MNEPLVIQGRYITAEDIALVRWLIRAHPDWGRSRLSHELCQRWNWQTATGRPKDMACRSLLRKLDQRGIIHLPPRRSHPRWVESRSRSLPNVPHQQEPIVGPLTSVTPVVVEPVMEPAARTLFQCLLARYHYLGFHRTVGENMQYLAWDRQGRPLACLLFGSAAWQCAPRDAFIGWTPAARAANLPYLTNNMRFLILPWVSVPHLASHLLGQVTRRLAADWQRKYGHPIYLVETFVDQTRFRGTSYRAANWIWVGKTAGRSRNDRYQRLSVPVKDIYLYPLRRDFREVLSRDTR